jgi:hypothetical protein
MYVTCAGTYVRMHSYMYVCMYVCMNVCIFAEWIVYDKYYDISDKREQYAVWLLN